jgi:hypothetical protein
MTAILSLLVIVTLSILVTRTAAVALTHTGLARQTARFQARSAFTGAGFTTAESEQVVNHPVRRRIVLLLMLLGNAGIVTAVTSLILAFVRQTQGTGLPLEIKIALLVGGLVVLWAIASSRTFDRLLSRIVDPWLSRHTDLDVRDYAGLLHLSGDYRIVELAVEEGGWLDGRTLAEVRPAEEGILVLGVATSGGDWLGTPAGDTRLHATDTLIVYGRTPAIDSVEQRRRDWSGERDHARAVADQRRIASQERSQLQTHRQPEDTGQGD